MLNIFKLLNHGSCLQTDQIRGMREGGGILYCNRWAGKWLGRAVKRYILAEHISIVNCVNDAILGMFYILYPSVFSTVISRDTHDSCEGVCIRFTIGTPATCLLHIWLNLPNVVVLAGYIKLRRFTIWRVPRGSAVDVAAAADGSGSGGSSAGAVSLFCSMGVWVEVVEPSGVLDQDGRLSHDRVQNHDLCWVTRKKRGDGKNGWNGRYAQKRMKRNKRTTDKRASILNTRDIAQTMIHTYTRS